MNEPNQTSNAEVQNILAPKIEALARQTTYAKYEESSLPPISYREVVGEKGMKPAATVILEQHFNFMRNIRDYSANGDGLAIHYKRLSVGIEKGRRLLRDLKALGYIQVKEVPSASPNGGKPRCVPSLTVTGRQTLEAYEARS